MLPKMSDAIYPEDCNQNLLLQHEGIPDNRNRKSLDEVRDFSRPSDRRYLAVSRRAAD